MYCTLRHNWGTSIKITLQRIDLSAQDVSKRLHLRQLLTQTSALLKNKQNNNCLGEANWFRIKRNVMREFSLSLWFPLTAHHNKALLQIITSVNNPIYLLKKPQSDSEIKLLEYETVTWSLVVRWITMLTDRYHKKDLQNGLSFWRTVIINRT